MNIHSVINNRQWLSECDNALNFDKKPKDESQRQLYCLVTLVMQGAEAYNKDLVSGNHYCHDCSSDRGYPVYHSDTDYFISFTTKYRRFAAQLQDIHTTLY